MGSIGNVEVEIYDKGRQMRSKKSSLVKETFFIARCIGDEWINSDRPITRVEIRLGRKALKSLGVNTFADMKEREHAIVNLITHDQWYLHKFSGVGENGCIPLDNLIFT